MAGERILSIVFDPSLLKMRESVLRSEGYAVVSVLGSEAGKAAANNAFDLFMVGHAAPWRQRREMTRWLKQNFPGVPVICFVVATPLRKPSRKQTARLTSIALAIS